MVARKSIMTSHSLHNHLKPEPIALHISHNDILIHFFVSIISLISLIKKLNPPVNIFSVNTYLTQNLLFFCPIYLTH